MFSGSLRRMERTPIIVITPKSASFAEAAGRGVKRTPLLTLGTLQMAGWDLRRTAQKPGCRGSSPALVGEAVGMVLSGRETVAAAARITGADPAAVETLAWETAKRQVHERDAGCCTACLAAGTDVHHRVSRARGFGADPVIAFGFANTTLLCVACHRKTHDVTNPEMAARGYRLERRQSPEAEPLVLFSNGESGVRVWLTPIGEYASVPQ
jgi:hypothetical protein